MAQQSFKTYKLFFNY